MKSTHIEQAINKHYEFKIIEPNLIEISSCAIVDMMNVLCMVSKFNNTRIKFIPIYDDDYEYQDEYI